MTAPGDGSGEAWGLWPCAMLRIDEHGLVVAVNARFLERTGYKREQVVGRMGWSELLAAGSRLFFETQLAAVLALGGLVEEVMVDLLGADGQRLPALMNVESVTGRDGQADGARLALMTVPDRRDYENTLRQARAEAEQANHASTQARGRLELLAAANAALASSVDVDVALTRLARTLVPRVADWCLIYALDDTYPDAVPAWAAVHASPGQQPLVEQLAELLPANLTSDSALTQVLDDGEPILLTQVTTEHQGKSTDHPAVLELYAALDIASAVVVPSIARGQRVAAIILVRGARWAPFTEDDLADLSDLGARTGVVIDNLRLYAREHGNSVALQQALLTAAPQIAPFAILTRYLPASAGSEVGGDWYDAFAQPDGGVAVVIGDVVGHDIHAAAAMGQLRGVIRTIATTIPGTPAGTLMQAERAAGGLQVRVLASVVVAQVQPRHSGTTGGHTVLWSNAGHPPPVLISRHGDVRLLEARADPLLGVLADSVRHDHSVEIHPGDTLLLYTDGIIERPDEGIDAGLARLVASLAGSQERSLSQLCDAVLAQHDGNRRDDIALLALRVSDAGAA